MPFPHVKFPFVCEFPSEVIVTYFLFCCQFVVCVFLLCDYVDYVHLCLVCSLLCLIPINPL